MSSRLLSRRVVDGRIRRAVLEALEDRTLFALSVIPFNPGAASTLTNALIVANTGLTVSNSTFVGEDGQAGRYNGFAFTSGITSLSMPDGVLLTTGLANNALPPNNTDSDGEDHDASGDTNLTTLVNVGATTPVETFDANSLTINFTTSASTKSILFDFVFASEEFPEFVGSFNDAFAAYLDGVQISFDSQKKPITVNNNFFTLNNSGITNPATEPDVAGKTPVTFAIQYDGLTPRITTQAPLDGSRTNHTLKLVIADTADGLYDSAAFLTRLRGSNQTVGEAVTGEAPTADAGGPYSVAVGAQIALNGTGSDPDQSATSLKYAWDLDGDGVFGETGAAAANGVENVADPVFKANGLTGGTQKTVTLRVTDNDGITTSDTAIINITGTQNGAPTANAGGPYTINEGSPLSLNGSGTDPDGDTLSFTWDVNGDGTYGDATGATPTLTWTQLKALNIKDNGTFTAKVRVTDSKGAATTSAGKTITVNNVAPTAGAGADKAGTTGQQVSLTGTVTDPGDADTFTYLWTVSASNGQAISNGTAKNFSFTPTAAGIYTLSYKVSDDDGGMSNTDTVVVTVTSATQPAANAGGPYTINEGSSLSLSGSAVGVTGTFSWDVNSDGTFGDATGASPTLSWTQLKALGIIDGNGTSNYTVKVRITPSGGAAIVSPGVALKVNNVAPTANAGADKTVVEDAPVTLIGSATDPAGAPDPLTYSWVVVKNGGGTVASGSGASITFTPADPGTYTATLTANDGDEGVDTDTASIIVTSASTGGFAVTSFVLVDADSDTDIRTIVAGDVIDLAGLPTRNLNVRILTSPGTVGSVQVGYDAMPSFAIENIFPYAMFGNTGEDFDAGKFQVGQHVLTATPYEFARTGGQVGTALSVGFRIIDTNVTPKVTSFVLVNANTGADIRPLVAGDTLDLSELPAKLSIRAVVIGPADSVRFGFDGNANYRVEVTNPWSLFGNTVSGAFLSVPLTLGSHTVTASPFTGPNADHLAGFSLSLTFDVIA